MGNEDDKTSSPSGDNSLQEKEQLFPRRIIAKAVDLFVVFALGSLLPWGLGLLGGLAYALAGDALRFGPFRGQSLGKRLLNLRVICAESGEGIELKESIVRNLPVGVAVFLGMIPVWGWVFMILVGGPLLVMELYLMFRAEKAQRLGDVMADTAVELVPFSG